MTLWGVLDSRSGHPWIWTDSVTWTRRAAQEKILGFMGPSLEGQSDRRAARLRRARRFGLRAVKVRIEVTA